MFSSQCIMYVLDVIFLLVILVTFHFGFEGMILVWNVKVSGCFLH